MPINYLLQDFLLNFGLFFGTVLRYKQQQQQQQQRALFA